MIHQYTIAKLQVGYDITVYLSPVDGAGTGFIRLARCLTHQPEILQRTVNQKWSYIDCDGGIKFTWRQNDKPSEDDILARAMDAQEELTKAIDFCLHIQAAAQALRDAGMITQGDNE